MIKFSKTEKKKESLLTEKKWKIRNQEKLSGFG